LVFLNAGVKIASESFFRPISSFLPTFLILTFSIFLPAASSIDDTSGPLLITVLFFNHNTVNF